ncbi:MAG: hypothetical protein RSC01_10130, partial [Oscillospiraceae bacterium]
ALKVKQTPTERPTRRMGPLRADSGTFLVSLSVAKEIHYVVLRNRALSACAYLALLYVWTNAVISAVIY